jgi:hypothetical protein
MSSEILYAGLIGALVSLFFALIFGIPKLIAFIVKELKERNIGTTLTIWRLKMNRLNKRAITIVLCIILGIALIASIIAFKPATETKVSEYTITFYNNKGIYFWSSSSGEERMSTKYQDNTIYKVEKFSGGYPSEPTPPKNEGYVFLGWYQNPECTEKFLFGHYEINSDINLYAKWGK